MSLLLLIYLRTLNILVVHLVWRTESQVCICKYTVISLCGEAVLHTYVPEMPNAVCVFLTACMRTARVMVSLSYASVCIRIAWVTVLLTLPLPLSLVCVCVTWHINFYKNGFYKSYSVPQKPPGLFSS